MKPLRIRHIFLFALAFCAFGFSEQNTHDPSQRRLGNLSEKDLFQQILSFEEAHLSELDYKKARRNYANFKKDVLRKLAEQKPNTLLAHSKTIVNVLNEHFPAVEDVSVATTLGEATCHPGRDCDTGALKLASILLETQKENIESLNLIVVDVLPNESHVLLEIKPKGKPAFTMETNILDGGFIYETDVPEMIELATYPYQKELFELYREAIKNQRVIRIPVNLAALSSLLHQNLADEFFERDKPLKAQNILESAHANHSLKQNPNALTSLGFYKKFNGHVLEAFETFENPANLKTGSRSAVYQLERASAAFAVGKEDIGLSAIQTAADDHPNFAPAQVMMMRMDLFDENTDAYQKRFERTLAKAPTILRNSIEYYLGLNPQDPFLNQMMNEISALDAEE